MVVSARVRVLRRLAALSSVVWLAACSAQGCQGCGMQEIPGGFPQAERLANGGQIRITPSGLTWLSTNFSGLVNKLAGSGTGSGLSFDIPPSCGNSQRLCCDGSTCSASIGIKNASFTPEAPRKLKISADAEVKTTKILFEIKVLIPWFKCEIQFDSTKGSKPTVGIDSSIDLAIDTATQQLQVSRGETSLRDFDCGDIDITEVTAGGFIYCNAADLLCPLFKGMIEDQLRGPIESTVDQLLDGLPTGYEGRMDIGALFSYFSKTGGLLDFSMWGGGYAQAENGGMSVGALMGVRSPEPSACVPNCEKPGATCKPPSSAAIPRSDVFKGNTRPHDGKAYHVGFGAHRQALDRAAYALYRSGALCLRMDSATVYALKSDLFALLIPSLSDLTGGKSVPIAVELRPQQPPFVTLGKGTWHKDAQGEPVIDDPLLSLQAKDLAADVFVLIEERYVRVLSIVADLDLPFLLFADGNGDLQPVLGDLEQAIGNVRVENAELLSEDPTKLAKLFPTLISVAGQALASGFQPIALPDIQGIQLMLDEGALTSVDNGDLLAVFAQLALLQPTSGPLQAEAVARIEDVQLPTSDAFAVTRRHEAPRPPTIVVAVDARVPQALAASGDTRVEWSYRVDGGFYRPWATPVDGRLRVTDPALWLQGEHTVDVIARMPGHPRSASLAPVTLRAVVDTVPPAVRLVAVPGGVRAIVEDAVAEPDRIELAFSIDGGPLSAYSARAELAVAAGHTVEVRARDTAGNVGRATGVVGKLQPLAQPAAGGGQGCALAGGSPAGALGLLLGLAVLVGLRRRRSS